MIRASRGQWRQDKADQLLDAAAQTRLLWAGGGLTFAELADDIAVEARLVRQLGDEIDQLEDRITTHYQDADPTGIIASAPGVGPVLAPLLLGRLGDAKRFRDLAAVRNYTGLIPKVNQSGTSDHTGGLTKAGDPLLREALFMAADHARKIDPTLSDGVADQSLAARLIGWADAGHVAGPIRGVTRTRSQRCGLVAHQ